MERCGRTVASSLALLAPLASLAPASCFTDDGPGEDTTVSVSGSTMDASSTSDAATTSGASSITVSASATTTGEPATTSDASDTTSGGTSDGSTDAATTSPTGGCPEELCDGIDNDCDGLVDERSPANELECDNCTLLEDGDSTYWLCKDNRTWQEAFERCDARGARLVTTETMAEATLILLEGPADPDFFWLGLNDLEDEGSYRWHDGMTPADYGYEEWADGHPIASPDFNCVYLDNDLAGGWYTAPCNNQKSGYVCEATLP